MKFMADDEPKYTVGKIRPIFDRFTNIWISYRNSSFQALTLNAGDFVWHTTFTPFINKTLGVNYLNASLRQIDFHG